MQEALAFLLIPILYNGGWQLSRLIPHQPDREYPPSTNSTINIMMGGTPEEIAPMELALYVFLASSSIQSHHQWLSISWASHSELARANAA